jgi:hypothetical protein
MHRHEDELLADRTSVAKTADDDSRTPAAEAVTALQQTAGNRAVAQLISTGLPSEDPGAALQLGLASPGASLPADLQREIGGALGADLSTVRVHTGSDANDSARDLGARAYTVGEDVVLGDDVGSASSDDGKRTLAHELTHVVQQRSGPVDGTDVGGGVSVSDPSDRFEQEATATADAVMGGAAAVHAPEAPAGGSGSTAQREAVPEEELVGEEATAPSAPEQVADEEVTP